MQTAKRFLLIVCFLLGGPNVWAATPTPISSLPFVITSPGVYIVTRDLSGVGGGLQIAADNVAIDMQGHSITGDGSHGLGIYGSGNHVLIANGTIAKLDTGIFLAGVFNTVAHMTVRDNTGINNGNLANGIILYGTGTDGSNTVIDSVATGNTNVGIGCAGCGGVSEVSGSQATNNGTDGIYGFQVVSNSIANGNGASGILRSNFVTGATANGNDALIGIWVDNSSVTDSDASRNASDGILISGGSTNSTAKNNGGRGIFLNCPMTAFNNTAVGNFAGNLVTSDSTCVLVNVK